ncbi:MAG TPA: CapA family protein, partial [Hyalangium sp.]|nr:CapA family protein [Hyalangium sp.]
MSGRSVLLWVLIPFLGLCALALWLTRPASPPAETREEQSPAPAVPSAPPVVPRPEGNPPAPADVPSAPPNAPHPATPSPPART